MQQTRSCGSELAHEDVIETAKYLADVPTTSRTSSLPLFLLTPYPINADEGRGHPKTARLPHPAQPESHALPTPRRPGRSACNGLNRTAGIYSPASIPRAL